MVRIAIWHIAIAVTALAALGERASADEPIPAAAFEQAAEAGYDGATFETTSALIPEEPPSAEPPMTPGAESVPPGDAAPAEPGQTPDGMPLPPVADIMADEQPAVPVVSSNCWFAPNHWYATTDFMVINYNKPKRNTRVALDLGAQNFLAEQNLNLGITEGGRFVVGVWRFHDTYGWDHAVEASFFGATDWHRHFDFIGITPGSIFTFANFQIPGFNAADAAFIYYKAQFNMGGIDLRWTKRPCKDKLEYDPCGYWKRAAEDGHTFSFLLGIHDAELDERFTYLTRRNNTPIGQFSGDYTGRTTNNLIGLHVGSELQYKRDLWYVGIRGGSTICVNIAEVDADLNFVDQIDNLGSGSHHENAHHTGPGAISDMSLLAGWQIRPNVKLHASYDFLWLTGVATAPSQLRLGAFQPQAINVSRDTLFTGASLGLEFNW